MVSLIDFLTVAATVMGIATSGSFFLQAMKIWKTKSSKDISEVMFAILCIALVTWLAYGIVLGNIPLIISNALGVVGATLVLILTLRFRKKK